MSFTTCTCSVSLKKTMQTPYLFKPFVLSILFQLMLTVYINLLTQLPVQFGYVVYFAYIVKKGGV